MVKNTKGGSHKHCARKDNGSNKTFPLRYAEEEGEIYSVITKILGGGMCHVNCIDGKTRLCIIRGKFRGKGKRDNTISIGTWVLVGAREWESTTTKSTANTLSKCDLLEVYSDMDKKKLQSTLDMPWSALIIEGISQTQTDAGASDAVDFNADAADNQAELAKLLMETGKKGQASTSTTVLDLDIAIQDVEAFINDI